MTDTVGHSESPRRNVLSSVRMLTILAVAAVAALGSQASSVFGQGAAQPIRPGIPLPGARWEASRLSGSQIETGHNITEGPFKWATSIGTQPTQKAAEPTRFCVFSNIVGPIERDPGGTSNGPETGGQNCGLLNPKTGLVENSFIPAGSLKQFTLETTESWMGFDIGSALYPPSVEKVRLRFAGGASTVLPLRRLPASVQPPKWEPFRYVSFAVYGCVNQFEGLSKGKVVARVNKDACGG